MRTIFILAFSICFSAVSAHAATLMVGNKREDTVSFINLDTGKEVVRSPTGRAPHEIAVSPDGKLAVVVSYRTQGYTGNSLHVFEVETGKKLRDIDLGAHKAPHGLKWIPGTRRVVATAEGSQDIVVVDVDAGQLVGVVETQQTGSHLLALSPNAGRAYVANLGSGSFTVIDLKNLNKVRDVKAGRGTEAISISKDGLEIWVGNNGSKSIMVFDAESFEKKAEIKTDGVPIRVEVSPDGLHLAVSEFDLNRVSVYDTRSKQKIKTIDLTSHKASVPVTLMFAPGGKMLWVATTGSAKIIEIDTKDWSVTRTLDAGEGSDGLGYSELTVRAGR